MMHNCMETCHFGCKTETILFLVQASWLADNMIAFGRSCTCYVITVATDAVFLIVCFKTCKDHSLCATLLYVSLLLLLLLYYMPCFHHF